MSDSEVNLAELQQAAKQDRRKYNELEATVKENTVALKDLTSKIDKLTVSTEGLVAAWYTANNVHKFIKWLSGLGVIGLAIVYAMDKLGSGTGV